MTDYQLPSCFYVNANSYQNKFLFYYFLSFSFNSVIINFLACTNRLCLDHLNYFYGLSKMVLNIHKSGIVEQENIHMYAKKKHLDSVSENERWYNRM